MMVSATHYADICVTGGSVPQVIGTLLYRTHGFLTQNPETVAVAFPSYRSGDRPQFGPVLRCFGEPETLNALLDTLENGELWIGKRIRPVPAHVSGYSAFVRRQLPSRVQEQTRNKAYAIRRRQDMLKAMSTWPYTFVRSQSKGLDLPFSIERRTSETCPEVNGVPNAYGLSRPSSMLYLPDFP